MSFVGELKRRNVFRTAIAYIAGAWLITEVLDTLFEIFAAPDWCIRLVVILLAFGIVPALYFAWAYKMTPEGLKRDLGTGHQEAVSRTTALKLDRLTFFLIIIALLVILADLAWLHPPDGAVDAATAPGAQAVAAAAPLNAAPADTALAVLPFVSISPEEENEYFADGVTEELISLLSRIPGLRVTSRSSAFSYKGRPIIVPMVAGQLNVEFILEGSVRKSGKRIRITTQLIEATSDTHVWSESYDRKLDDIFAVQEDIAGSVANKLALTLVDSPPPRMRKADPDAYTAFLTARRLGSRFTLEAFQQSYVLYQRALSIDARFADAWNGLAHNYINQVTVGHVPSSEGFAMARAAANEALEIDPDHAPALANLSVIAIRHDRDLVTAARYLKRALALEPANPEIQKHAATLLRMLGRMERAIAVDREVVSRDPVNPASHYFLGFSYLWAGRWDEAIASLNEALMLSPGHVSAHYRIGQALYYKGELERALEEMTSEPRVTKHLMGLAMVYHALGMDDESDEALNRLITDHERTTSYNIAYLFALRGEHDRSFEWLEKAARRNDPGLPQLNLQPEFASLREDPRWLPFVEGLGLAPTQLDAIEF